MGQFLQAAAGVLLAVVLGSTLARQGKDLGLLLTVGVCCMVMLVAMGYLEPVVDLLKKLETMSGLEAGMLEILLKCVGIGLIGEISALISSDAGQASLGKALQLLGAAVILWLSIPVFTALMDLVDRILGGL